jgi:hypothetical protein
LRLLLCSAAIICEETVIITKGENKKEHFVNKNAALFVLPLEQKYLYTNSIIGLIHAKKEKCFGIVFQRKAKELF